MTWVLMLTIWLNGQFVTVASEDFHTEQECRAVLSELHMNAREGSAPSITEGALTLRGECVDFGQ